MAVLYIACAAIGGTILLLQFLMTLIGLGGDALDIDLPDDVDTDIDVSTDADFDADVDAERRRGQSSRQLLLVVRGDIIPNHHRRVGILRNCRIGRAVGQACIPSKPFFWRSLAASGRCTPYTGLWKR